jgi:hypothetical protein
MDGKKVMDRIYTVNDEEYMNHFIKWSDDNGYYSKKFQNFRSAVQWKKGSNEHDLELKVKLDKHEFNYYPYFDTFKFLDLQEGVISNVCQDINNSSRFKCLVSPSGGWESSSFLIIDHIDREYYYNGDMSQVVNDSGECVWLYRGNCNYSDLYDAYIIPSESIFSEEIRDYIYKNDSRNNQVLINEKIELINKEKTFNLNPWGNVIRQRIRNIEQDHHPPIAEQEND